MSGQMKNDRFFDFPRIGLKGERIEQRRNIREPRKRPSRQIHQDRESRCHIYRRLQSPLCFAEWRAKGTDRMDHGYGNNSGGFNQFGPSKPEQREESVFPEKGPQEDIPF